jgi:hypothetical protein
MIMRIEDAMPLIVERLIQHVVQNSHDAACVGLLQWNQSDTSCAIGGG